MMTNDLQKHQLKRGSRYIVTFNSSADDSVVWAHYFDKLGIDVTEIDIINGFLIIYSNEIQVECLKRINYVKNIVPYFNLIPFGKVKHQAFISVGKIGTRDFVEYSS